MTDNLSALMNASYLGNLQEVEHILSQPCNVFEQDAQGLNALYFAVMGNHPHIARSLLTFAGRNLLDEAVHPSATCLYFACQQGYVEIVNLLLDFGCRDMLLQRSGQDSSCLYVAAQQGHFHVVRALLDADDYDLLCQTARNGV